MVTFFGCGRVEPHSLGSAVNFVVTKFSDITEKIIPFFDKYPLFLSGSYASIKARIES